MSQALDARAAFASFDFASRPAVAVALSGGSDSTAALLLLHEHLRETAPPTRIVALTVDHGLRPGSRREAEQVAALCARLGLAHRILSWTGDKPDTGLLAAAREARHDLLSAAAREARADMVVTGHTLDDQIETVEMRRTRGSGIGLAGMAPVTLFDGVTWLARPLLATRRDTLRAFLRERGIGWIDDPTNADLRYERPRLRAAAGSRAGFDSGSSVAGIAKAAARRSGLCIRAAALVADHARQQLPGLLRISAAFLGDADPVVRIHTLRVLLAVAGGTTHLPDPDRTGRLLERLSHPPFRATLSRALVASSRDGDIWLCREARDLPVPSQALDGMIWDGRFRIRLKPVDTPPRIAAVGLERTPPGAMEPGVPRHLARAALSALPCFEAGGNASATPVAAPWARYLPGFDIPLARAVSGLIGGPPIPDPPWRGHIVTRA